MAFLTGVFEMILLESTVAFNDKAYPGATAFGWVFYGHIVQAPRVNENTFQNIHKQCTLLANTCVHIKAWLSKSLHSLDPTSTQRCCLLVVDVQFARRRECTFRFNGNTYKRLFKI